MRDGLTTHLLPMLRGAIGNKLNTKTSRQIATHVW
jgi:hypothetical protein